MQPEYRVIEEQIKRARLERSLYIAERIADGIFALAAGFSRLAVPLLRRGRTMAERAWLGCLAYLP